MKPRCEVHNAPLRWTNLYDAWVCMAGTRDRTCKAFFNDIPAPVKPRRYRPTFRTWDGREILSKADFDRRRYDVWIRDGKRCQGEHMVAPGVFEKCNKYLPRLADMEADHIIAKGTGLHGRDDSLSNLRASCHACNSSRNRLAFGRSLAGALYAPAEVDSEVLIPEVR